MGEATSTCLIGDWTSEPPVCASIRPLVQRIKSTYIETDIYTTRLNECVAIASMMPPIVISLTRTTVSVYIVEVGEKRYGCPEIAC